MQVLVPLYGPKRFKVFQGPIVAFVPMEAFRPSPFGSTPMYDSSIYEMAAACNEATRQKLSYMGIHITGPILPLQDPEDGVMWVPGYGPPRGTYGRTGATNCLGQKSNGKLGLRLQQGERIAQRLLSHGRVVTRILLGNLKYNVGVLIADTISTILRWTSTTKILRQRVLVFLKRCRSRKLNFWKK